MSQNLKYRLDLLETQLQAHGTEASTKRIFQTRFAVHKLDPKRPRSEVLAEMENVKKELAKRKTHHCKNVLLKALKTFKQVEPLRIRKRMKSKDTPRLKQELELVLSLESDKWANLLLSRYINKHFGISDLTEPVEVSLDGVANNLSARLCKTSAVQQALQGLGNALSKWYEGRVPEGGKEPKAPKEPKEPKEPKPKEPKPKEPKAPKEPKPKEPKEPKPKEPNEPKDTFFSFPDDVSGSEMSESENETQSNLPVLQHGYLAGSESEGEVEAFEKPIRKNRRGQQARRRIWELKYGKQANHIKKEQDAMHEKYQERLKRRAEREARGEGPSEHAKKVAERRQKAAEHMAAKAALESKPMHPSWVAKREQEKKQKTASFAGKKKLFS